MNLHEFEEYYLNHPLVRSLNDLIDFSSGKRKDTLTNPFSKEQVAASDYITQYSGGLRIGPAQLPDSLLGLYHSNGKDPGLIILCAGFISKEMVKAEVARFSDSDHEIGNKESFITLDDVPIVYLGVLGMRIPLVIPETYRNIALAMVSEMSYCRLEVNFHDSVTINLSIGQFMNAIMAIEGGKNFEERLKLRRELTLKYVELYFQGTDELDWRKESSLKYGELIEVKENPAIAERQLKRILAKRAVEETAGKAKPISYQNALGAVRRLCNKPIRQVL